MKYTVKLLEADVISRNNRCYSKEVVERINEQLNSNTVNVYNNNIYYEPTVENKANFDNIVGQTIKYSSRIEKNTLIVDVKLIKPMNANFINLCCTGNIKLSNKARMSYNGNITTGLNGCHDEVEEADVVYLFEDNTSSYYNGSNIIPQNKLEIE